MSGRGPGNRAGFASFSPAGYFSSGWAFLVPYFAAYLLYLAIGGPVNGMLPASAGWRAHLPTLLHVFWALHAATIAAFCVGCASRPSPQAADGGDSRAAFWAVWLLLAVYFVIPGAYLEYPSDPWEHLLRINEWAQMSVVTDHPYWHKASYFLAYSLIGKASAGRGRLVTDGFYAGCCLLLTCQYYRLGRAAGLGRAGGLIFTILQVVISGNSVLSFYRYYGLSSSILSQIGAVALTERVLRWTGVGGTGPEAVPAIPFRTLSGLFCLACLVLLMGINHVQGIGIALLGAASVGIWRLVGRGRTGWAALLGILIVLNAAALLWMRRDLELFHKFRAEGWFSAWYGFNILATGSPAADRTAQILGALGLVNVAAGVVLLRRNQVVGWLTVAPIAILLLPMSAVTLCYAHAAGANGEAALSVFNRMLFAIPPGLALVVLARDWLAPSDANWLQPRDAASGGRGPGVDTPLGLLLVALFTLCVLPAARPFYGRLWGSVVRVPDDQSMRDVWDGAAAFAAAPRQAVGLALVSSSGVGFVLEAQPVKNEVIEWGRTFFNEGKVPSSNLDWVALQMNDPRRRNLTVVVVPKPTLATSARSFAAVCSGHWLPQEADFPMAGAAELQAMAVGAGLVPILETRGLTFYGPGADSRGGR